MTIEYNKRVVLRFNKEFLEKGDSEVLKEIVDDDFVNHTAPPNFPKDVFGMIQFANILHKGFSNMSVEIHEQLGENDLVSTRKSIHATHTGEIMGRQPTGKKVTFNVIDIVRIKDGKYVAHWGRNDIMQVIQTL